MILCMILLATTNLVTASWFSMLFGASKEVKDSQPSTGISNAVSNVVSNVTTSTTNVNRNGAPTRSPSKRHGNSTVLPTKHSFDDFLLKKIRENVLRLGSITKVLFLGDSLFYKVSRNKARWTDLENNYAAINIGSPGDRSEHILHRFHRGNVLLNITSPSPLVFVMIGISNANLGDAPNDIVNGISRTVSLLQQYLKTPKIIVLSLLPRMVKPVGGVLTSVNIILKDMYADQSNAEFLDITKVFKNDNNTLKSALFASDNITPSLAGQVTSLHFDFLTLSIFSPCIHCVQSTLTFHHVIT